MSPLLRKNDTIRLYPKKLNYLFLAVFAFFSPFCYAKTAFSYSPDILSPCTPDVTMVKNVVKSVSEKTICGHHFEVRNSLENNSAGNEGKHRAQRRKHANYHMWSAQKKISETMWSEIDQITWSNSVVGAENSTPFLPLQVLYCNSSSIGCQGRFALNLELKI